MTKNKNLSAGLDALLADADKRNNFPTGTMQSIMQQETGGNTQYLDDPAKYHYAPNKEGKRVASHTGQVSTAFGPFGILESTAAKPGYGVAPLKDKSLEEQIRFAAEYLAGRSKQAGSLEGGLAGYGQGDKYAKQVLARLKSEKPASVLALPDDQMNRVMPQQQQVAQVIPQEVQAAIQMAEAPANVEKQMATAPAQDNPWAAFKQAAAKQSMRPSDLDFEGTVKAGADPRVQQLASGPTEEDIYSVLQKFGIGMFAQDPGRYQASIPNFARADEYTG